MGLISQSIPSLFNGVSQQAPSMRLSSQAESMVNGYATIAEGLKKRPPTENIAKVLSTTGNTSVAGHIINRDETEQYSVIVSNGDLEVFDLSDGSSVTVAFPDGKGYLSATTPRDAFKFITVADHTFVVNSTITTAMDAATDGTVTTDAYAYISRQLPNSTYTVTVNGTDYSNSTGTTPNTKTVASSIASAITAGEPNITATTLGSVIKIAHDTGGAFTFSVSDSFGDQAVIGWSTEIQNFNKLPDIAFDNTHLKVIGDPTNNDDEFYVEFVDGTWNETRALGLANTIDPATMPHKLVRETDGTFTFQEITYENRLVGDADSIPEPSFIGKKIKDVFFFRNRLGFVSDEDVVMSRSGDFFNFWNETATALLDTDPIDISISHVKVSIINHALPFNETLLLFSDQTQFVLTGDDVLTPKTVRTDPTTEFETNGKAKPVGAGNNVYFSVNKGSYSAIREYFVEPETLTNDAADVTAHVPRYLPSNIFKMVVSNNEDVLFVVSEDERDTVYVYKYYWAGDEKKQSAWSEWTLGTDATIIDIATIDTNVYVVVEREDGVYLELIDINAGAQDDVGYEVLLDRKVELTGVYDSGTNLTTWTLPYSDTSTDYSVILSNAFTNPSTQLVTTKASNTTITAEGDYSSAACFVGRNYEFRYRFSEQFVRDDQTSVLAGQIQLRNLRVIYTDSLFFTVEVTPAFRDTKTYTFNGKTTGIYQLNVVELQDGIFRFPVLASSDQVTIDLVNNSYQPSVFHSAEFEAMYTLKSRRI